MNSQPWLLIAFALAVGCQGPPPSSSSATKIQPLTPWRDTTIQVVEGDKTVNLPARLADYPIREGLSTMSIVAAYIPSARKTFVSRGPEDRRWQNRYLLMPEGLVCFSVEHHEGVRWTQQFAEVPGNDVPGAIAAFEKTYSPAQLSAADEKLNHFFITIRSANDPSFFAAAPDASSPGTGVTVESLSVSGDVVHLALRSPVTGHRAAFWIDLTQRKIVRATADGREVRPEAPAGYETDENDNWRPVYEEEYEAEAAAASARGTSTPAP